MRPLLWKEMRDLRVWVIGGALLLGAFEALFQSPVFRRSWEGSYLQGFMPFLLANVAIGLGAGQIARERHSRSLEFLLVRPISQSTILWAKFLAGTLALALLVTGLVGFGFFQPQTDDTVLHAIRSQIGFRSLTILLFPRYWCVYALTLLVSTLLDRTVKAACLMAIAAITLVVLAEYFLYLAPFSSFVYWLPFIESTGGILLGAKLPTVFWGTCAVFSGAAILIAMISAALLRRSPERYVGNIGLGVMAIGLVGAAVGSAHLAANRFSAVPPVGSMDIPAEVGSDSLTLLGNGNTAVVLWKDGYQFIDFSDPTHPVQKAPVAIPLWSFESAWFGREAMENDTVYLLGQIKSLPVDLMELAIVRPDAPVEEIPLGPSRQHDFLSSPVPNGKFLYLGITQGNQRSIRTYDLSTRKVISSVVIDQLDPAEHEKSIGPFTLTRRGQYLYALSPTAVLTLGLADAARPVVVDRLQHEPKPSYWYVYPSTLAWQDNRLFEIEIWPPSLGAYDLSNPAHPVRQSNLIWHDGFSIWGSGAALYRPWQHGVLEFRAEGGELQTKRYLSGDRPISIVATSGNYVFALTSADQQDHRKLQAFR